VPTAALRKTTFSRFRGGEEIEIKPGLKVQTIALNHPGGATGYRFDWQGSSLAIITDHEHDNPAKDDAVRAFVENADVMVYDAMYTEAEYPSHVGWGHSTPECAIALAEAAAVQVPVLFHHDPYRSDDALDALTRAAKQRFPALETARYMMTIEIDRGRVSVDAVGGQRTAVVA
jgi:phosphoribosyl 1,2-cyclic phosphodiesterase